MLETLKEKKVKKRKTTNYQGWTSEQSPNKTLEITQDEVPSEEESKHGVSVSYKSIVDRLNGSTHWYHMSEKLF